MSLTIETAIHIAAPAAQVMQVLTDFGAYTDWNTYLVRVDGLPVPGSQIVVHAAMPGRPDPLVQTVDVVEVSALAMRWAGGLADRSQFAGDHWLVVEHDGQATRFLHFEHFSGALAPAILAEHGETIRDNFIRFNEALKRRTETSE